MERDSALDHAGRRTEDRPDITRELSDSADRITVLRVLMQREREGKLPPVIQPKNPKMRGLIDSVQKFRHEVDCDIEDATKLVASAHERRKQVFTKVRDHVGAQIVDLSDFASNFDDLEAAIGDNGAPSSEGDSKESLEISAASVEISADLTAGEKT